MHAWDRVTISDVLAAIASCL